MIKLFCGDCREILKRGQKDIVVSDPPFNIGYHYREYKDRLSEQDYYTMLETIFKPPCVIIHYPEALHKFSIKTGIAPDKVVSWVYNSNTGKQHRDIAFYGIKPDFRKVLQPYKNPNDKRIRALIEKGKKGARLYDWWNINQVKNVSSDKADHPCQMPLEVMSNIIGILPEDYTIIDPFLGSGTTGLACKQLNRDFIGIEKDKYYFDIASKRIGVDPESDSKNQITIDDII